MINPYTFEEVEKILTSLDVNKTAEELGRTYAAICSIRGKYNDWTKKGEDPKSASTLSLFKKFKENGSEISVAKQGRRIGFVVIKKEHEESEETPQQPIGRDPFTEFDILCSNFNKQMKELVYSMVQDVYAEHIKKEYERMQRKAFDRKDIKIFQKRILKGGNV